jgi:hypothetical protein
MADRILPAPDLYASCPYEGGVLEYYEGTFEAVYILLHPFIRAVSIETSLFMPETYPGPASLLKNCKPVSWAEVAKRAALPSIAAVDIGLRTINHGLKDELLNQDYADRIESLEASDHILPPSEGFFSELLHNDVMSSIQGLGYEWAWVGDEFCTERKLHWIEDLKTQEDGPTTGGRRVNVFTPDKALLWATHWDSHFSFLCSSKRNLDSILEQRQFEGFFCGPTTEVYWSVRG